MNCRRTFATESKESAEIPQLNIMVLQNEMNLNEAFSGLGETELFLKNMIPSNPENGRVILRRLNDRLEDLDKNLSAEVKLRENLQNDIATVQKDLTEMIRTMELLKEDRDRSRQVLLIRQLAYSYQSKLAEFVKIPNSKLSRTHGQVSKMPIKEIQNFHHLLTFFQNRGYVDNVDIDNAIEAIRDLGSHLSHSHMNIDTTFATETDIKGILCDLLNSGTIDQAIHDISLDVLGAIVEMCKSPDCTEKNLLKSKKYITE
jgi:hypothetical protein